MTALENFVSPALTQALGWTLLHSLWQGALVAGVLAGALLLLRRHRAELRYLASGVALASMLLLAGLTFTRYYLNAPAAAAAMPEAVKARVVLPATRPAAELPARASAAVAAPVLPADDAETGFWLNRALAYFDQHLPVLVLAWLLGLLLMTLRMAGGLLYVQRLRRYRVQPLEPEWQARLAALAARAGLTRSIGLLESALVQVPLVVGHLRPVILLPLGTVAGLSPGCLEAILAHELAHVVRRDYLLNLVQTVAEVLFFYHPAVWFMAACLRTERENCCDDAATSLVGGGLALARALTSLAELGLRQGPAARLSLAAVGPDGSLLGRVRRLVQRRAAPTFAEGFMAACVVMGGLGLLGTAVALAAPHPAKQAGISAATVVVAEVTPAAMQEPVQDEKPASRRRKKGTTTQVVVVQPTGGNRPGTVIIEKDKKGRLTDLYVNGRHVEGAAAARKGRKADQASAATAGEGSTWVWADNGSPAGSYEFRTSSPRTRDTNPARPDAASLERTRASYRSRRESLRTAERALASAARARSLSVEERSRLDEKRAAIRGQLESLRRQDEALRHRAEDLRRTRASLRHSGESQLKNDLVKDGLITDRQNYRFSLSSKEMVVNGVKQPESVHRRYLERYEQLTGSKLTGSSTWVAVESGTNGAGSAVAPLAPVAPLPPLPPLAPMAPGAFQDEPGRNRQQIERDRQQAERDRQQTERDRQQLERDRQQAERDRQRAERDRERAERDRVRKERSERTREAEDRIIAELMKDGLIKDRQSFRFALNSSEMVVDGVKQPEATYQKYRRMYESGTGHQISGRGSVILSNSGSTINRIYLDRSDAGQWVPAPPAPTPPAAPQAPKAPKPPKAPAKINSIAWGDELRKDGLIGPNDKSYRVELNAAGFTVNGKRQPEELARKYRALAGHSEGQSLSLSITED